MAIQVRATSNYNKNEQQNVRMHQLTGAPASPVEGQYYWHSTDNKAYIFDGSGWLDMTSQGSTAPNATAGTAGLVQLAGDLGGTGTVYSAPVITNGAITTAKLADASVTGGTAGAGVKIAADTITAANLAANAVGASELADGIVTGGTAGAGVKIAATTITNANINASAAIDESKLNLASDAAAATASRRTIGTGALQAAAGNHTHADAATGTKGFVTLATAPAVATSPIAVGTNDARVTADQAAGTASIRTIGTGALQAAAGNDTRFHTQNTDTGTSGTSFYLVGTAATDVRIKKNANGEMGIRLGDDSGYAALQSGALTVNGNLTVTGTTTTVNSNTLSVGDNIIELNNDVTTTAGSTEDGGITIRRYTGADVRQDAQFIWQESSDRFAETFPASSGTATVTRISALKYTETLGAVTGGSAVTVTHSLNTREVAVSIRDTSTNEIVLADVIATTVDAVTVTFGASAGAGAYAVAVVG